MSGIFDEIETSIEEMRENIVRFSQTANDVIENSIEESDPLVNSIVSDTIEEANKLNPFSVEGYEELKKLSIRETKLKKLLRSKSL